MLAAAFEIQEAAVPHRLTAKSLTEWRAATLQAQTQTCALCLQPLDSKEAVADHNHTTGQMRGVLHRSCNSLLGVLENNRVRYGMRGEVHFTKFLHGVVPYLARHRPDDTPLYPSHRTADEKRELRNKRARRARAAIRGA